MTLEAELRPRSILGLLSRGTLLDAGLTPSAIKHRVVRGRLHRIQPGVYSLDAPPFAPETRMLAAVLACGPGAALSHHSAAVHWRMLPDRLGSIHVSSPRHRTGPPGVITHRIEPEATTYRHVPVTTPARTLRDLAASAPHELERALNEARILKLVTESSLVAQLTTRARGTATLRAAIDTGPTLHRSQAERRFLALVTRARLPRPETNVRVAGYEVDAFFRTADLVVEIDGYAFHSTPRAFERDRRKDADLQAAGHRVLRLTWRQITTEPEVTVAAVARAL